MLLLSMLRFEVISSIHLSVSEKCYNHPTNGLIAAVQNPRPFILFSWYNLLILFTIFYRFRGGNWEIIAHANKEFGRKMKYLSPPYLKNPQHAQILA
jgi:hypothetical protein